jgi:spore coat polysaccharide biosynthesis predicted glycosyltransferase SpsG
MTSILCRCGASLENGSGHVVRCRTFACELQRLGAAIAFVFRRQLLNLIGRLEQEFSVLSLPEQPLAACLG